MMFRFEKKGAHWGVDTDYILCIRCYNCMISDTRQRKNTNHNHIMFEIFSFNPRTVYRLIKSILNDDL